MYGVSIVERRFKVFVFFWVGGIYFFFIEFKEDVDFLFSFVVF